MQQLSIFLGFVPWIAFAVISGPSTLTWASATALVLTIALAAPAWRRTGSVGVLDVGGIAFFAIATVLTLVLDAAVLQTLEDRAQLISGTAITLISLVSLLAGRPFTEYYARQSTPREYWTSPVFRGINRVLTGVWTGVFALMALCDLVVATAPAAGDVLDWVVPALLVVGAVKFTEWYPDHVTGDERAQHGAHEARPVSP
jgi:hypothetical protein